MRTVNWMVFVIVLLPLHVQAQDEAPPAEAAPEAPAVEAPPASAPPVAAPAAPAPAPAPPVAAPAPPVYAAPPAAPPVYAAPPPTYYAPPAYAPPAYAPPAAPPPGNFSPQPSPLLPPPAGWHSSAPQPAAPQYAPQPPAYNAPRGYTYQPQPDPSLTLPPLPPGYMYVPMPRAGYAPSTTLTPADLARREQLYGELYRVDSRLDALQHSRVSLGGPITMMVIGYGASLIAATTALAAFASAEQIEDGDYGYDPDEDDDLDWTGNGSINQADEDHFRKVGRISAGVAAASLVFGIWGSARLSKRRALKREQAQEAKSLSAQRDNLRRQLDYGASVTGSQFGATVGGRF